MGFFDKDKTENTEEAAKAADGNIVEMPERKPFQSWTVGGETYRLKLRTPDIAELEQKYKTNLMNVMGTSKGGMPALTVMLDVAHAATRKYHHSIKRADVNDIFDRYIDEGGSQLEFYTNIYMGIFAASGFFSASLENQMEGALEEAREIL
jgi:hypothetical protein